jgi:hypothetical protein
MAFHALVGPGDAEAVFLEWEGGPFDACFHEGSPFERDDAHRLARDSIEKEIRMRQAPSSKM